MSLYDLDLIFKPNKGIITRNKVYCQPPRQEYKMLDTLYLMWDTIRVQQDKTMKKLYIVLGGPDKPRVFNEHKDAQAYYQQIDQEYQSAKIVEMENGQ